MTKPKFSPLHLSYARENNATGTSMLRDCMICWWLGDVGPTHQQWEWYKDSERLVEREREGESNCLETGGCSRILICLLSPGSNWAPQDVVIFKSDMSDPAHLRCVIMHQAQRCGLKLSLMLCALGFIFPIKSANYMIIPSHVQGPFWKWVAMVFFPPPSLMVMLEMRSTLWLEY